MRIRKNNQIIDTHVSLEPERKTIYAPMPDVTYTVDNLPQEIVDDLAAVSYRSCECSWNQPDFFEANPDGTCPEHPEVKGRPVVRVVHPSAGLFGGPTNRRLIDVEYRCLDPKCSLRFKDHTHGALYGPEHLQLAEDCKTCNRGEIFHNPAYQTVDHPYEPHGVDIYGTKFVLYAD